MSLSHARAREVGTSGAALFLILLFASPTAAQQTPPTGEELERLRERVARALEPGPEHRRLAALEGGWSWERRTWPSPGAEPVESVGRARMAMRVGGRFLEIGQELTGGEMAPETAVSLLGFDRRHEAYTMLVMDSWGTYWVTARGPWSEEEGGAVLSGEERDPILGHTQSYDFVLRFPDPDTMVYEIHFKDEAHTGGTGSFRMVETVFSRDGS